MHVVVRNFYRWIYERDFCACVCRCTRLRTMIARLVCGLFEVMYMLQCLELIDSCHTIHELFRRHLCITVRKSFSTEIIQRTASKITDLITLAWRPSVCLSRRHTHRE